MTLALTILRRELLGAPRRKRFYLRRILLIAFGGLIVAIGYGMSDVGTSATGLVIFVPLCMAALGGISLMALASSAYLIWREREEQTLEMVLVSGISLRQLVFGKLVTSNVLSLATILSTLPLFLVGISLGGISAEQILAAGAVLLSTVFLASCIGLYAGAAARTERGILGRAVSILLLYVIALPATVGFLVSIAVMSSHFETLLIIPASLSPVIAMISTMTGTGGWFPYVVVPLNVLFNCLLGGTFLRAAPVKLQNYVVAEDKPEESYEFWEKRLNMIRARMARGPGALLGNPVTWRDYYMLFGGRESVYMRLFYACGIAFPLIFMFTCVAGDAERHSGSVCLGLLYGFSATTFVVFIPVLIVGSLHRFSMAFHRREIRDGCMEMLLLSDLSVSEIIWGKIWAVVKSILPWLIAVGAFGLLATVSGLCVTHPSKWPGYVLLITISLWLEVSALALWMSLRFGRGVALGAGMTLLLLWLMFGRGLIYYMLYVFELTPSEQFSPHPIPFFGWPDFVLPLLVAALALRGVFRGFRQKVVRGGA